MNVTLVNRPLSLFAGIALAIATMSFRAPENSVSGPTSVVLTSTTILVNPNPVLSADHVIVTLESPSGAVVGTRYTTPGQTVSFARPSDYTSGYSIKSEYFTSSNEFIIVDGMQM